MIHSLSGGVIAQNEVHTFLKVEVNGETLWYLSPGSGAAEGKRALVPYGRGELPAEGTIIKVVEASAQCAPVPMKRLKEALKIL